jgi:hypothetical protein
MSRRNRRLLLALILTTAAVLRFWKLDSIPPGFHFDEAFEGLEAWRILTEPGYWPIFLTGNFGVPPLNAYANAITFGLFRGFGAEAGPLAMRTTAAVFGMLGVLAVYALAYEMRRQAPELPAIFPFLAAASLAIMRWHIHFSRMGIEPITVPLIWAAGTWQLLRSWRTGSWLSFLLVGALGAASLYAYQGAWVVPILLALVTAHLALADRQGLTQRWPGLAAAGTLALILAAPLGLFLWQHPDLALLRPSQVTTVGATGSPADASLWANLWATAKMFNPLGNPGDLDPRRNLPGAPALSPWLALPFFVGLLVALGRVRRPTYSLILIGLVGLLLPGVVTEYAPHFHRVLGASAPVALLCGLGLAWLWQQVDKYAGSSSASQQRGPVLSLLIICSILILAVLTSSINYFGRWAKLPELFYAFDAGLWQVGQWIAEQPDDTPIYLSPRQADHPTLAFAWRTGDSGRSEPISFDGRHIMPLAAAIQDQPEHYVVVEHEDFRSRLLLPEIFPEAAPGPDVLDDGGELYARVYTRPPGAAPQKEPRYAVDQALGDGIHLLGYDLTSATPRPGDIIYLQLHWLTEDQPASDWTVFTHVVGPIGPDGSPVWAGQDSPPGNGSLPTRRWQAGWRILDEYQLQLPNDLPAGTYQLEVGLYQPNGGRLPAQSTGLIIGSLQVEP